MNKRLKGAVLAIGLAAGGVVTVAAPAQAEEYQPPQVFNVAPVVLTSNGEATVTATYQCFGGDGGGSHLYIGVKQGPGVNTTNHSTSASSSTFYSTNWRPGLTATCDGTVRTDSFLVKDDPFWAHAGEAPALRTGAALVQFCLFDSTNSGEEGDETGFAWKYSMRGVLAS
jgi:hypothetical protein